MSQQVQLQNLIVIQVRSNQEGNPQQHKLPQRSNKTKPYLRVCQIQNNEGLIFTIGDAVEMYKTDI